MVLPRASLTASALILGCARLANKPSLDKPIAPNLIQQFHRVRRRSEDLAENKTSHLLPAGNAGARV
jgi:hypothetical protein